MSSANCSRGYKNDQFGTRLATIDFPALKAIGESAFAYYYALTRVSFEGIIAEADFSGVAFIGDLREVYFAPSGGDWDVYYE